MANPNNEVIINIGPPPRLIRQATIIGRCSYCGGLTQESCCPNISKYFHFNCKQHMLIHNPNFRVYDSDEDDVFSNMIE
jgi:hypothetical protein